MCDKAHYTNLYERVTKLEAEVAKANAKLPHPPMTNGVPRALVLARLRRYEERLHPVSNVTETVTATQAARPQR